MVKEKVPEEQEMSITIDSATSRTADRTVERAAPTATDNRAEIAREIARAKDPEKLKDLVSGYILDATRNVATPGDRLESIKKEVIKLRPGDRGFPGLVKELGERLALFWQAQGRTHEVWDKLLEFTGKRNWAGVKAEVTNQLKVLVVTSPTEEAVRNYYNNVLLACGPREAEFKNAVFYAVSEFVITGPAKEAERIAHLCKEQGPERAAQELRKSTDPEKVTPLEAAEILKRAKPTIDIICKAFRPTILSNGQIAGLVTKPDRWQQRQQQMFSDLSAAVDSGSRSSDAAAAVEQIARVLCRGTVYDTVNIRESVAAGNLLLPLAMLKQLRGPRDGGGPND